MVRCQHRYCYPCYPYEYVSLQANTLFSTHLSRRYKPLTHPVDHTKRKKDSPFKQAVIFLSRNPPQKCLIANLPRILYMLDSKTVIYLKNDLSYSNNLHAPYTTKQGQLYTIHRMDEDIRTQYLLVAHQSWMVKCSHRTLELSQSN